MKVHRPFEMVKMNVGNCSSRSGQRVSLIVLHDTESHDLAGVADLRAIGAWFDNPDSLASAHVCVDAEGHSAQYVSDSIKAWHCAGFNSVSLGIEQIGFASFGALLWRRNARHQLRKSAQYIAYWSDKFGIPIVRGTVKNGVVVHAGVVMHSELGVIGGGHHDPGSGYPIRTVLRLARHYKRFGWK